MKRTSEHINRSSIVLLPEDERIISLIQSRKAIPSRTQAIRFALRQAIRNLEYERIRQAYLKQPETREEILETKAILKATTRGMERERW